MFPKCSLLNPNHAKSCQILCVFVKKLRFLSPYIRLSSFLLPVVLQKRSQISFCQTHKVSIPNYVFIKGRRPQDFTSVSNLRLHLLKTSNQAADNHLCLHTVSQFIPSLYLSCLY